MKKHITTILIVVLFLVGLGILLYPTISNYINKKNGSRVISKYEETVQNNSADRIREMIREAEEYNQRLAGTPMAFYHPERLNGYRTTLDITGTGIMGYIDIERINLKMPIYHSVEESVLQVGIGHLEGSSLPVGGSSTHAVLSGHRGLPSARLFTDLDELEIGDLFTITVMDQTMTYRVDQIKTVLPEEAADLQIIKGKDFCTLITCTPYGINSHRLLVRGIRVENVAHEEAAYVRNEALQVEPLLVALVVAIPVLLLVLILIWVKNRIAKKLKIDDDDR